VREKMANTEPINILPTFLKEIIKREIEAEYDETKKKYVEKFEKEWELQRDKVIAGIILNVSKYMTYQDMGTTLRIEILKREVN
jgi:hypothetical protein